MFKSKKKYTEQDMRFAIRDAFERGYEIGKYETEIEWIEKKVTPNDIRRAYGFEPILEKGEKDVRDCTIE